MSTTGLDVVYMPGTPFETRALRGVTIEIAAGEILGLVGSTGSGKSTFLQAVAGLLDVQPGMITYGEGFDPTRLHEHVGMVFQMPEDQLFERTVLEDVGFGPRQLGRSDEQADAQARRALERVGLDPVTYGPRSPGALSGGEKRRAALAGILAMEPRLLLLDEPTAGLDSRGQKRLLEIVRNAHSEGVTVVLVTHDLELLVGLATRVAVFHQGQLATVGPAGAVLSATDQLRAVGLRAPFVAELLSSLGKRGCDVDTGALTVEHALAEIRRVCPRKRKR